MGRKQLQIGALLVVVLGLAFFLWPRDKGASESNESAKTKSASLEARRTARSEGTINTSPARLAGLVVDKETQEPLAGVVVAIARRRIDGGLQASAGEGSAPRLATTDAQGRFELDALPPARYHLSASKEGFRPGSIGGITLQGGEQREDLRLELASGGLTLSGKVSDIGGGPVPFAFVRARRMSDFTIDSLFEAPFTATTDDEGNYRLNLEDGGYEVRVFHSDYRQSHRNINMGGNDQTLDFELTPGSTIEGVVKRRDDDSPVAGAMVSSNAMGERGGFVLSGVDFNGGAVTDEEGHFVLRGLGSGAFELRAVAPRASSHEPTIVELGIAETATEVVVYVDAAYKVSGFVVRRGDHDIAESEVMVGAYNMSPGAVFVADAPSASDGYFEIHGVHPGTYTVGSAAQERTLNPFGTAITVTDKDIDDLVIEVDLGHTIVGRVDPPGEARITLEVDAKDVGFSTMFSAAGALLVNTRSNAQGEFTLKGITPGTYDVVAKRQDGSEGKTAVDVQRDLDNVVVKLETRAVARGIVIDEGGNPVAGVQVDIEATAKGRSNFRMNGPSQRVTMTGEDGRFEHVGLDNGTHEVSVRDGGQLAWAGKTGDEAFEPIEIEIKNHQDLSDLQLRVESRNHQISGNVIGPEGKPLADAWVTARWVPEEEVDWDFENEDPDAERSRRRGMRQWSPAESPVLTDAEGNFVIDELRSGHYDIEAEGLRGGALGKVDKVPVDTRTSIRIEKLGSVKGKVSVAGETVGDYVVHAQGPTRRRVHVVNTSGSYSLSRLEPGSYEISITSAKGIARAVTDVKNGEEAQLDLTLASYGSVSGVLLDTATGEPIARMGVIGTVGEDGSKWAESAMSFMAGGGPRTDDEGRFRLDKLGAGSGTILFIDPKAGGFDPVAMKTFELEPGQDLDLGEIRGLRKNKVDEDQRGTLGLYARATTAEKAKCEAEEGVEGDALYVVSVVEGGPADQAGVQKCDRIVAVQGVTLEQVGHEAGALQQLLTQPVEVGTTVSLETMRQGNSQSVQIQAAPAPSDETP